MAHRCIKCEYKQNVPLSSHYPPMPPTKPPKPSAPNGQEIEEYKKELISKDEEIKKLREKLDDATSARDEAIDTLVRAIVASGKAVALTKALNLELENIVSLGHDLTKNGEIT